MKIGVTATRDPEASGSAGRCSASWRARRHSWSRAWPASAGRVCPSRHGHRRAGHVGGTGRSSARCSAPTRHFGSTPGARLPHRDHEANELRHPASDGDTSSGTRSSWRPGWEAAAVRATTRPRAYRHIAKSVISRSMSMTTAMDVRADGIIVATSTVHVLRDVRGPIFDPGWMPSSCFPWPRSCSAPGAGGARPRTSG
jgi:hypothetical protein